VEVTTVHSRTARAVTTVDTVTVVARTTADTITVVARTTADTITVVAGTTADTITVVARTTADTITVVAGTTADTITVVAVTTADTITVVAGTTADTVPVVTVNTMNSTRHHIERTVNTATTVKRAKRDQSTGGYMNLRSISSLALHCQDEQRTAMNTNEQQRTRTHINGRHSSLTDKHLLDHSAPHNDQCHHHGRHHLLPGGPYRRTLNHTLNKLDFIRVVCSHIIHCGRWLTRAAQLDTISLSGSFYIVSILRLTLTTFKQVVRRYNDSHRS